MHESVMTWVDQKVARYGLNDPDFRVLEVGSLDVNGSVRPLFSNVRSYTGLDQQAGRGVDVVANAHQLPAIKGLKPPYDVVISTEMLEHDPAFWRSLLGMSHALRPGGYLLLTARGNGFPKHDYPHDMYRFTTESFRFLLDNVAQCDALEVIDDPGPRGVFGFGRRRT
jgi:SAM-dependent methyltransferase